MASLPEAAVAKHRMRGVVPRSTRDSAAGVGARAAKVEALERHAVIGRTDHGTGAEQLVEAHLAVENVAADQPKAALEVERRVDLASKHRFGEARCVAIHRRDDRIGGSLALIIPAAPLAEVIAEMLAEE